jgi:phage terminase small subunit
MAGRPSKPVELIVLEGRTHLTKKQIEDRRKKEESLKSDSPYQPNKKVKSNPVALEMFYKLQKLYKKIDYVDGLDENIINRYCLLTAEVDGMEMLLQRMESDIDKCKTSGEMVTMYKSISGMEGNLNRSRDMLLKMEDRMFLNPTARVKNVPKKQEEPPKTDIDRKFGNV